MDSALVSFRDKLFKKMMRFCIKSHFPEGLRCSNTLDFIPEATLWVIKANPILRSMGSMEYGSKQ